MAKQYKPGNLARRGLSGTTLRAVAAGAAVLLAVAACGSKPSESAGSGDSKDPIVVGISLPLTGDFSQPGGEARCHCLACGNRRAVSLNSEQTLRLALHTPERPLEVAAPLLQGEPIN